MDMLIILHVTHLDFLSNVLLWLCISGKKVKEH